MSLWALTLIYSKMLRFRRGEDDLPSLKMVDSSTGSAQKGSISFRKRVECAKELSCRTEAFFEQGYEGGMAFGELVGISLGVSRLGVFGSSGQERSPVVPLLEPVVRRTTHAFVVHKGKDFATCIEEQLQARDEHFRVVGGSLRGGLLVFGFSFSFSAASSNFLNGVRLESS